MWRRSRGFLCITAPITAALLELLRRGAMVSGLIGLECDTPEGLAQIEALGLPATVTVESSETYKQHFWFRPSNGDRPEFVAFRFEKAGITPDQGRYLLVPPAVHPSGATYTFLRSPEDTEIAVLPAEKYAELVRLAKGTNQRQRERLQGDPDAKVTEGKRRETIFRFACSQLAWGAPPETIHDAAQALNRARFEPLLSEEQVAAQVDGALGRYEPGTALKSASGNGYESDVDPSAVEESPFPPSEGEASASAGSRGELSRDGTLPERFLDAADLLAEDDPGPTRWLVSDLIVDQALIAAVGRWKVTKSYGILDLCIAIATGRPAFGTLTIPEPGAVIFVNEESGRAALWRRLDALCRGRAIDPEELRGRLIVAPNAGVKLDDARWQNDLLDLGAAIRPRLFIFDPLARLKDAKRVENEQSGMAPLIDFMRDLRNETGAAVGFVHHTGHTGSQMRGSSDLESAWETRLTFTRDGQSPLVKIESEHREAEAAGPIEYRIASDHDTRSMRFNLEPDQLDEKVAAYLREHPDASANEVFKETGGNRPSVLSAVKRHREQSGTNPPVPLGTTPL